MTVSRVINGREGVDVETQRRVEAAIEALDYVPNRIARGLISQKTQTIGLIVPDVVNPFFSPVVRGAETTARKAGYRVLLCNSEGDLRLEREYVEDLVSHRVEGLCLRLQTTVRAIAFSRCSDAISRWCCLTVHSPISIATSSSPTVLQAHANSSNISSLSATARSPI